MTSPSKPPRTKIIIGILGGSVAQIFCLHGTPVLETELRKHPAFASKKIEFVHLAVGGYKQPGAVFFDDHPLLGNRGQSRGPGGQGDRGSVRKVAAANGPS